MSIRLWIAVGGGLAVVGAWAAFGRPHPGDPRLNAFARGRPPVPVVFTSRTDPTAFDAAAPAGEGFAYPGQRLWAAREGRLRVLTPRGTVRELTWGNPLPDGGTLIDVMSPNVTLDGERVLFAGRRADDAGRFRLYEVRLDGSGLRPLTGGPDDPGCEAVPPMRFAADGSLLPDDARKRTDYDDVDPAEVSASPRRVVFASSRAPDLGPDGRRATQLWQLGDGPVPEPLTGSRANDRWPFPMTSGYVAFSLWSRNREAVTADETDVRPADGPTATRPPDSWLAAFVSPGGHFGMLAKPAVPVWRPRPLFDGRIAFMTGDPRTVAVAPGGLIEHAPSSLAANAELPRGGGELLSRGPVRDGNGRPVRLATPSPCPPGHVLLAADAGDGWGIYVASDTWPVGVADWDAIGTTPLFDDPELVDAEPVAAYPRAVPVTNTSPLRPGSPGTLFATGLDVNTMADLPGQATDANPGPRFAGPPAGALAELRVYAARRDRFDHPTTPRLPGGWERLATLPVRDAAAGGRLPTDTPTVLAGFGADGKVLKWTPPSADAAGRRATFYAVAGDHYSLARPGGRHFCVGCHPGHSGLPAGDHRHAERVGE